MCTFRVDSEDNKVYFELWYPRVEKNINSIVIGLVDVRVGDSIKISYDFERDGWKIEKRINDKKWTEVSFIENLSVALFGEESEENY